MDPTFLSTDELEIECLIRNISGSVLEQLDRLKAVLKLENEGKVSVPEKMHTTARKAPQRELYICSEKLRSLKPQVQEISNLDLDERGKKLAVLSSRILHVSARLQRITNTSPKCKKSAQTLLIACEKVLEVIQSLLESRVSVDEFEKSASDAIPENNTFSSSQDCPKSDNSDTSESEENINNPSENTNLLSSSDQANLRQKLQLPIPTNLTIGEYENLMKIISKLTIGNNVAVSPQDNQDIDNVNVDKCTDKSTPQKHTTFKHVPSGAINSNRQGVAQLASILDLGSNPNTTNVGKVDGSILGIHKWNIAFDGSPSGSAVERFLYRVERLAIANRISAERLVNDLYLLLRKSALEWYWSFLERSGNVSWEELKKELLERFKDRRTDAEIRQLIGSIRQKYNESFMDFYTRVIDSTLPLSTPLPDADLYFILRRNMNSALQYKIAGRQIVSVSELVHQCVDIEDTWKRLSIDKPDRQVAFRHVHELVHDNHHYSGLNFQKQNPEGIEYPNFRPSGYAPIEKSKYPTAQDSPGSLGNPFIDYCNTDYYKEVSALGVAGQPINHHSSYPNRFQPTSSQDVSNWRNPNMARHCYGCGAPNVIKPNCQLCNSSNAGNNRRGMRTPGVQPPPKIEATRTQTEDVASNTCPELYRP